MRSMFVRIVAALVLTAPLTVLATPTPTSGTLNTSTTTLTFSGGFIASDPSGGSCLTPNTTETCDEYTLTVALPSDYAVTHPNAKVRVSMAFDDIDYDLSVLDADTFETIGSSVADNPEVVEFAVGSGTKGYLVDVLAFTASGGTYVTTITLIPGTATGDSDADGVGDADDLCPGTPPGTTVDATGCPLPDSDGDGVDDSADACPGTPAGTPVDATGCALPDADGDGVTDADDACADTPPGTAVDGTGCPIDPNNPKCTAPGLMVMTDAAGDQVGDPDTDIVSVSISESVTTQRNIVFTVKMASLTSLTANARRIFTFKKGATDYYVAMISAPEAPDAPAFVYGTGINGFGTGSDKLGDGLAGSGYTTDGTFTVVAPITAFGLAPGDSIGTFAGVVRLSGGSCTFACVNGAAADTATAPASNTYMLTDEAQACPGPADTDGDGVLDSLDNCPNTPAGTTVDASGCPLVVGDVETCDVPGKILLTDASGDNTGGPSSPLPGPAGTDLLSLQISQPAQDPVGDNIDDQLLVFRINIDPGAVPSPATIWFASFKSPTGALRGVRMTGDSSGNPLFESYTVGADNGGGTDGRFATGASPAHSLSTFDSATGAITIWVRAAALGFASPGEKLEQFNAGVMEQAGGAIAFDATDGMPNNDLSRSAVSYTLHDNTVCGGPALKPPGPPQAASGPQPRFYDLQSPAGRADHAGEPTVGYNPFTNAAMFIAGTEVDRVTFAEHSLARDAAGSVLPESCPAAWDDASYAGAVNTLDPILETEPTTGRTFQSSLSGANSIFAFSDDDGVSWTPGQAGPPNGGADHQTVGVGPWAPGAKPASATEDYAIYYCSQSIVAAFCARSETGGITFGPGIPFRDSVTDCDNTIGGLHGHVQVARNDGTVYVPFGNCGEKVGVAVSTDSGTNWTVKKAEPTSFGDDPGLGIADDGTAYLCYAAGDKGKPYATVSRDRGDTWTEPYDLGAFLGITHAVFTTAVAGDGERAACGFIGTTSTDTQNPGNLLYTGVWYAYVAMTYDRGKSWHLVNVSGGDPVQGAGGICTDGTTCGNNRNLLDFNDVIKSEQGRLLFGYADGCRGACVTDPASPAKNGLADNGVMARQSGGRTLLAAFDDNAGTQFNSAAPITPAAACAREDLSYRTSILSHVEWNAGDTGGSPIVNYKVYRGETATGPWTFLADTIGLTTFEDATALDTVEKYYYKVVAENAKGAAVDSNVIELPISLAPPGTSCEVPGITVGFESVPGDCTGTGGGCTPQTDIQRVQIAEPPDRPDEVVLTIKVGDLNPTPAPGNYWFFLTKKTSGENLYFAMDTSQGAPRYTYGTYEVSTLTSFTEQGTITGSFEVDGQVHLYAPKARFGTPALEVGDSIVGIDIRTRSGASAGTSRDTIVGDDYVLRGIEDCFAVDPPVVVASLDASILEGKAVLDVTFTIAGAPSTGEELASYSLTFGDEVGANPPAYVGSFSGQESVQVTHRYLADGAYRARLSVTDSAGHTSANVAEKTITVLPADPKAAALPPAGTNNMLGGPMAGLGLLVMALSGLARIRRRRSGRLL